MSNDEILLIIGTATTDRSEAIRDKIGCSHPSVHSICESKKVNTCPYFGIT